MAPTAAQISVALDALRKQATGWAERSTELGKLASDVTDYYYNPGEGGIFWGFIDEYNAIIDKLEVRLKEGELAMKDIARTLNTAADVYEQEDLAREHEIRNLY
ncbi:type VII secretion target [Nocardia anaemiae]|uniref:type VII secretion target n=1 Tax=Nocardia anaemiae TaxID=263910 RepID=UPI0007A4D93B|nr:type VII secretion target [Nocardia anaemiae]